jgi:cathepsin L
MMMFRFLVCVIVSLACVTSALPTSSEEFKSFQATYKKSYATAEEALKRQAIFEANLAKIAAHNKDPRWTYSLGVNQFADMTSEEFATIYAKGIGRNPAHDLAEAKPRDTSSDKPVEALPKELDWRTKNVVTPAKNQGGCGSCWAFSTAETLESHIAIKTGKLLEFSPQEFVSCAPNPNHCGGTGGCQGSTQPLGFKYAISKGITTEKSYPYSGTTGTCQPTKIKSVATISGYEVLPTNNYSALMNAVVNVGPIAISAAAEPWQLYSHGVYNGQCGADVDHAIQLVGYGTQGNSSSTSRHLLGGGGGGGAGGDYWLVRNSWGASWGEKGYIRIKRFGAGKEPCETDNTPGDGYACEKPPGPKSLKVCGLCGIMSASSYPTGGKLVQ